MTSMIFKLIIAAVVAGTPLLLGALGEILTEKSGNTNLGVEGMMFMGAVSGITAAFFYGKVAGDKTNGFVAAVIATLFAFLIGAFGALIYAFLTITLRANQNVTGLTLTIFGTGFGNFFGDFFAKKAGGTLVVNNIIKRAFHEKLGIPVLKEIPYIGKLIFGYNWIVYLAIIMAVFLAWFFNKSRVGLNMRAVGENPAAADAASINVTKYKYIATIIGGGICGIGGMYISLVQQGGTWVYNCVSGYGWLAVSLVIFATWNTSKALWVALVFGALKIARFYVPLPIPSQFYDMAPYIVTIIVLILTSIRQNKDKSQPASCGYNYFREER